MKGSIKITYNHLNIYRKKKTFLQHSTYTHEKNSSELV